VFLDSFRSWQRWDTQSVRPPNRKIFENRWKYKIFRQFRIRGKKFLFSPPNLFSFVLSVVFLFISLSYCLLPLWKAKLLSSRVRVCNCYLMLFWFKLYRYFNYCFVLILIYDLSVYGLILEWWIKYLGSCKCLNIYIEIDQLDVCMQNPKFETKYWKKTLIIWPKLRLRKTILWDTFIPSGLKFESCCWIH
jgi:hypothetical protein